MGNGTKTVGSRIADDIVPAADAHAWQDSVAGMMADQTVCERGVFRFARFEEAQRWLMDQVVRSARASRRKRTSGGLRRG